MASEAGAGTAESGTPGLHRDVDAFEASPPRRIVSLVPSLSEALVALGLGDRLVGVTGYCVHPAGAFDGLARVGGTKDADVEAIAGLAPELVIANQEENTERVVGRLAERGIPVWLTYPRTVEEGARLLEALARLGASPEAVREVVWPVREAVDAAVARRRAARGPRPRVFCPIWRDPWMTVGRDTYIHDLLELCGAENVFAEPVEPGATDGVGSAGRGAGSSDRRYPIVDLERIVAARPDVVLLPDEPYAFGERDRAELAALDLPAARSGRLHLIDGTLVSWYGPRIAQAIRVLAGFFATS